MSPQIQRVLSTGIVQWAKPGSCRHFLGVKKNSIHQLILKSLPQTLVFIGFERFRRQFCVCFGAFGTPLARSPRQISASLNRPRVCSWIMTQWAPFGCRRLSCCTYKCQMSIAQQANSALHRKQPGTVEKNLQELRSRE